VYVAQIVELKREQAQRLEEVCILRESQRDCISMTEDIQHMQNCIEEQRKHMLRTSERHVDPGVGLHALLRALSDKERERRQDLLLSVHVLEKERKTLMSAATASQHEYTTLMQNFQVLNEYCTGISQQLWFVAANAEMEEQKNREATGTIERLNQANKHLQKEIKVQYACIEEQRRHMRGEHRDGDVGIHMLIESVKQNEVVFFQEKLAAHGIMVHPRYQSPVIQNTSDPSFGNGATHEAIAKQRDEITTQRDEITTQRDEITTQRDEITTQRDEITTQRDEITKLREVNDVVVGRSKKLCIVLHGLLDVKTTEITKMKALLTKLVHSLSEKKLQMEELVASNLKLKTINVEALKSRDGLQVKLYNVILEKQKSDVEMQTLQETMRKLQHQTQTLQGTLAKCQKQNTTLVAFSKRVTNLTQNIGVDLMHQQ
jgi:chromosome segregation ATPase